MHLLTRDAKITELDLALIVEQNVGGFDISVDHPVLVFQVVEGVEGGNGHLAADVLRYRRFQQLKQLVKACGHQFHANPNVTGSYETPKTDHNLLAIMRLQDDVHVHHNPLSLL